MATFIVRNIDPEFWRRVKAQAALEGISLNALVLKLLSKWLKQEPTREDH